MDLDRKIGSTSNKVITTCELTGKEVLRQKRCHIWEHGVKEGEYLTEARSLRKPVREVHQMSLKVSND